jgi:hypothetical protein
MRSQCRPISNQTPATDAKNARDALLFPPPTLEWHLLAPLQLNFTAASVLERDLFNEDFEAEWKIHLETLSDEEVRAMDPQKAFCGLFDRIKCVTRVYENEIARRAAQP